jgi:hypothetical protein
MGGAFFFRRKGKWPIKNSTSSLNMLGKKIMARRYPRTSPGVLGGRQVIAR